MPQDEKGSRDGEVETTQVTLSSLKRPHMDLEWPLRSDDLEDIKIDEPPTKNLCLTIKYTNNDQHLSELKTKDNHIDHLQMRIRHFKREIFILKQRLRESIDESLSVEVALTELLSK